MIYLRRRIHLLTLLFLIFGPIAFGLDGVYLGGEFGHVGLTGTTKDAFSNALGFGVDLGFRVNPNFDLNLQFQTSSHSGGAGLNQFSQVVTADLHLLQIRDFDLMVGVGPGLYIFKYAEISQTKFGVAVAASGDVMVGDQFRVGLAWKWHNVFSPEAGGSFYNIMMRVGYWFKVDGL